MDFKDKTVLVTGASRGIGKAIATAFGQQGASVVVNYQSSKDQAEAVVELIKSAGGKAIAVKADVSNYQEAEMLVKTTVEAFGGLDVLINNSGITKDQLMMRMQEDDFDKVIAVNLKGAWNMVKHSCRMMLKQKHGRIINISSVVGLIGNPGQANYVASKAAINGITKSWAKEFGKKNITVNAIAPGFIDTEMTENLPQAVKDSYLGQIPLNRLGQASEVAETALFLASEKASYITGQVISVNGGMI